MINLLRKTMCLCRNVGKWIGAFLLCWLYAYMLDKVLDFIIFPNTFYEKAINHGVCAIVGGLSTLTVLLIFADYLTKKNIIPVLLFSSAGFFLGNLIATSIINFLSFFEMRYSSLYLTASLAANVLGGFWGGILSSIGIFWSKRKSYSKLSN